MCIEHSVKKHDITKLKDAFYEIKAKLTLLLKGNVKEFNIENIPKEWSFFNDTEDQWINIDFPETENTTACLYIGKKGSHFSPHKHPKNIEHFTILNKGGKVKVITNKYERIVSFPNSICFEINEPHAVDFLEDTRILCMWHPKMKGWNAEFTNK